MRYYDLMGFCEQSGGLPREGSRHVDTFNNLYKPLDAIGRSVYRLSGLYRPSFSAIACNPIVLFRPPPLQVAKWWCPSRR
jgi:hypothetical protein